MFRGRRGEGGVCMQFWMEFFSIVAAIALVVQVGILIALFLQLKRTTESINRMVNDLHSRMGPILTRTQILLDDTQPKIANLVEDASQIVYLARGQAQRLDRIVGEASDRLRGQLVQGIKIGLDVLRSRRGPEPARESIEQEDELFI